LPQRTQRTQRKGENDIGWENAGIVWVVIDGVIGIALSAYCLYPIYIFFVPLAFLCALCALCGKWI
jgi:hypothetical protein